MNFELFYKYLHVIVSVLILVSIGLKVRKASKLKKGDLFVSKAIKLIEKEKFSKALTILEQALFCEMDIHSKDIVYALIARCYLNLGLYEKAIEAIEEGLKLNPDYSVLYLNGGRIYKEWHKYDLSEKYYKMAIEKDPGDVVTYIGLGSLYIKMNETDKAIKILNDAANVDKTNVDVYEYFAMAYAKRADREKTLYYIDIAKSLGSKDMNFILTTLEVSEKLNKDMNDNSIDIA